MRSTCVVVVLHLSVLFINHSSLYAQPVSTSVTKNEYRQNRAWMDSEWAESADYQQNWTSLSNFLLDAGEQFACHFTFENLAETEEFLPALNLAIADIPKQDVRTVDELIEKLRKDLDGVTIERTPGYPNVIRIVETQLLKMTGYDIDKKISLTYSGTPMGMLYKIHELVPGIVAKEGGALPLILGDFRTSIQMDVKETSIRFVLTKAVPLTKDRIFLWEATTYQRKDGLSSEIFYFPVPREDRRN